MVELELDEREEVQRAILLRQRTSGVGTKSHSVCTRILNKLADAEVIDRPVATDARAQLAESKP